MSSSNASLRWFRNAVVALGARLRDKAGTKDRLSLAIILTVLVTTVATFVAFVGTAREQAELALARVKGREQRVIQQALLDLETGARGFSLTNRLDYLHPYIGALQVLDDSKRIIARLDQDVARSMDPPTKPISALIEELRVSLAALVDRRRGGAADAPSGEGDIDRAKATMDQLRAIFAYSFAQRVATTDQIEERLAFLQRLALVLQLVGGGITLSALIVAFRASSRQTAGRVEAVTAAVAARRQVEHLFAMTDILQSATGYADANAVLVSTARRLLPDFGGSLYIFNNSRDRLDLSVAWSSNAAERVDDAPATISSDACWAMKRGKPHINEAGGHALRCEHAATEKVFLEIPMLARGEVYGLLQFIPANGVAPSLTDVTPLAIALADGMSLALSSIALREKLRNQALRDPLTGLHNRRFMEEVLERFVLQAERRGSPVGAIMIDLDHFKRLNDQHGHAIGDAVLRDVAGTLLASLRRTDVACRYGGEELLVLLPDADLAATMAKAELIRARIADLSSAHGFPISASLGVAAFPETSAQSADLLKSADAALYQAKHSGRDKVVSAAIRTGADQFRSKAAE